MKNKVDTINQTYNVFNIVIIRLWIGKNLLKIIPM